MNNRQVIAAIRRNHLKANIGWCEKKRSVRIHWDDARVDRGGTIFGDGPYLKVPVTNMWGCGEYTIARVYAPARLRRRLAAHWIEGD